MATSSCKSAAAAPSEGTPLLGGDARAPESQRPQGSSRTQTQVVRVLLVGLLHVSCSAGLILFNKHVMSPDRFPFAVCLTTLHMFAASVLSALLHAAAPQLFPSANAILSRGKAQLSGSKGQGTGTGQPYALALFAPVGVCCAVSVVCANSAYNYASVSFLQMVKESVLIWVYLLGVLVGLESFEPKHMLILSFVTCSAALAVCSEVRFTWVGLALQTTSSLSQASQAVLTNRMMRFLEGVKMDPLSFVLGSAPLVFLLLLPVSCALLDSHVLAQAFRHWHLLLANAIAAFALQVVNAVTIWELSATGLALAAVLKDLAIVASAAALLHETLTHLQLLGFSGAVCGIAAYSFVKLRPKLQPEVQLQAQSQDGSEHNA